MIKPQLKMVYSASPEYTRGSGQPLRMRLFIKDLIAPSVVAFM